MWSVRHVPIKQGKKDEDKAVRFSKGHPGFTTLELLVGVNVIQEVMLIPVLSSFQQHKSIC